MRTLDWILTALVAVLFIDWLKRRKGSAELPTKTAGIIEAQPLTFEQEVEAAIAADNL